MITLPRWAGYCLVALAIVAAALEIRGFSAPTRHPEPKAAHTPADLGTITVYPKGRVLPTSFSTQPWTTRGQDMMVVYCRPVCEALVADIDSDGNDDIVMMGVRDGLPVNAQLFRQSASGHWLLDAQLSNLCAGDLTALRHGDVKLAPSRDAIIGGRRVHMVWLVEPCATPTWPPVSPQLKSPGAPADLGPIGVFPKGNNLPTSFLTQPWTSRSQGRFTLSCAPTCEALMSDLDGDGNDDIILMNTRAGQLLAARVFRQSSSGRWLLDAAIGYPLCAGDLSALQDGDIELVPSDRRDMIMGGRQVRTEWMMESNNCPTQ